MNTPRCALSALTLLSAGLVSVQRSPAQTMYMNNFSGSLSTFMSTPYGTASGNARFPGRAGFSRSGAYWDPYKGYTRYSASAYLEGSLMTNGFQLKAGAWHSGYSLWISGETADITFTMQAPTLTVGLVKVTGPASSAMSGYLQVGKDSISLGGARTLSFWVTLGPKPLTSHFYYNGNFAGMGNWTVYFEPRSTAPVPYGGKCNATLAGAYFTNGSGQTSFVFDATNAPSTPFNFILFGTRKVSVPMPPSNCPLLTDMLLFVPISITKGAGRLRLTAPSSVKPPYSFNAQLLGSEKPMPNVFWRTSNGLTFDVK